MKMLCAYFSRTGHTKMLMKEIVSRLEKRGHSIEWEKIKTSEKTSRFAELLKDLHNYPGVFASIFKKSWRNHLTDTYIQTEEDIQPLAVPDISRFDRIVIAGPKWARISYPVARYITSVQGLAGKKVGSVSTFGGPPLRVFEIELIEKSMNRLLEDAGAFAVAHLGISSAYHELGLMPLFRCISRIRFCKPVKYFSIGTGYANKEIDFFCDQLERD